MEQKYVVVGYADEWYEEGKGKVCDTYEDARRYIVENLKSNKTLLDKLEYIHTHKKALQDSGILNKEYEIIISYC